MLKIEVDTSSDECWGDDQANDLDIESIAGPGIVMQHDASDVTYCC